MIYSISSACLRTHCQQPVYFISVNTVSVCLRTHCQQPVCFISVNTVSVCLRTHCQQPVYFISVNTVSVCLRTHCQQPVYFIFENTVSDFLKFVGPSGQKITRTGNTAKYAGLGVRQKILFCTGNQKCNWYARAITVNSELDSASNDIYFLNMQLFP